MKKLIIMFALSWFVVVANGQSQSLDTLKKTIYKYLDNGECDQAQRAYENWRFQTKESDNDIETKIEACQNAARNLISSTTPAIEPTTDVAVPADKKPTQENTASPRPTPQFIRRGHNSYLAWRIINIGYPWKVTTSLLGRHGGSMGIGYYFDIGLDIEDKKYNIPYSMFHYGAGLKFFPYRDFFISAGYETLGSRMMPGVEMEDLYDDQVKNPKWRKARGIPVMIGRDVITGDIENSPAHLSFGLGAAYDFYSKDWEPMMNFSIGIAWGIE